VEAREYEIMAKLELVHWWYRARRALLLEIVGEHARSAGDPMPRLLDLGSGTGANAAAYAAHARVVGVEPSAVAVRLASTQEGPRFARAEGIALPFPDRTFGVAVASDVLEHIADDASTVREIARVLKPGGVFVFSVPAHPWLWSRHDEALAHQRRYGTRALRDLMGSADLRLGWLSHWNGLLFPIAAARRLRDRLFTRRAPVSDVGPAGPVANWVLERLLRIDTRLARGVGLPVGLSLVGWAKAP
jgi:SAM-dependent methyltransferase